MPSRHPERQAGDHRVGGHRGERIGEASRPGPGSRQPPEYAILVGGERVVLSQEIDIVEAPYRWIPCYGFAPLPALLPRVRV